MPEIDLLAVLAAAVAAFVAGGAYYAVLGDQLAEVSEAAAAAAGKPPPWELAVELGRCLIVAAVVAGLASQGEVDEWAGGLLLGASLWIGFPFVLWTGAVVHERTPPKLAAIHGGDWLVKLLLVATIVSVVQ
jgi:Protein of unknown function (DUF1761)